MYVLKFEGHEYFMRDVFPFHVSKWVHCHNELPMHSHDFIELVFVVSGSATHLFHSERYGEIHYKVNPGDVFIINSDERHTYKLEAGEQIEVINLQFYPQIIDWSILHVPESTQLMDFFYVQPFLGAEARFASILKLSPTETEEVRTMINKIEHEFHAKLPGYTSLIKLMLTELILRLSRFYASNPKQTLELSRLSKGQALMEDQMFKRMLGFVERHYNSQITLEELAELASCSTRQVTRIFKQMTGTTVINYLHKLRIDKSKQLLLTREDKVAAIGTEVGFNDISFFNKVFKKAVGVSPSAFRKMYYEKERPADYIEEA